MSMVGELIRKVIRRLENRIISWEGGEATSTYLRRITLKRNNVEVGLYSYGGVFDNSFNLGGQVIVGRYSSIGSNVRYFGANHPITCFSTSPYFYRQEWADKVGGAKVQDIERFTLQIGNDCWIGGNVLITCGCHKIGNGAIIGAGAVVTHDVEPYSIVAGNPAKEIRKRFSDEESDALEKSKWFDLTPEKLLKLYQFKDKPVKFANKCLEILEKE